MRRQRIRVAPEAGSLQLAFSGHGAQVRGANYLIPTGFDPHSPTDIAYDAVNVQRVLDEMQAAHSGVNVMILDACRDDPFRESSAGRSLPPGSGINFWAGSAKRFLPYHPGRMLLHDGLATHQAVLHPTPSDVPRIMLQGHVVLLHDELLLYW